MASLSLLRSPNNAETAALAATLLCVWIAAQSALWLPRKTPRLTTALALFALNWGILLLYYLPGPPQNEILAAFSGFVLVYIGILLHRETRESGEGSGEAPMTWLDKLPPHLFRITVLGFGAYLLAQRVFHVEYGYGTLALALWGTILTVLGYASIWFGVRHLYGGRSADRRLTIGLGLLLLVYSGCEWTYFGWYAHDYWPRYHRYTRLQVQRGAPDFEQPLPFEPRPDWPDYPRWAALRRRPDWPLIREVLSLEVAPRVPQMWLGLKYAFAVLKLLFTVSFVAAVWRRPVEKNAQR